MDIGRGTATRIRRLLSESRRRGLPTALEQPKLDPQEEQKSEQASDEVETEMARKTTLSHYEQYLARFEAQRKAYAAKTGAADAGSGTVHDSEELQQRKSR